MTVDVGLAVTVAAGVAVNAGAGLGVTVDAVGRRRRIALGPSSLLNGSSEAVAVIS